MQTYAVTVQSAAGPITTLLTGTKARCIEAAVLMFDGQVLGAEVHLVEFSPEALIASQVILQLRKEGPNSIRIDPVLCRQVQEQQPCMCDP